MGVAVLLFLLLGAFFACGYAAPNKYIIGGEDIDISDHPYQVSVQWGDGNNYFHMCGGAIIHENYVLTAYHCCKNYDKSKLFVVAGENNVEINNENKKKLFQVIDKKWIHLHTAEEDEYEREDDLCVLQVVEPFDQTPIEYFEDELGDDKTYTLTGWGVSSLDNPKAMSERLKKTEGLKILPRKINEDDATTCEAQLLKIGYDAKLLTMENICTFNGEVKTVCNGDSGGPLVYYDNTIPENPKPLLVGIVSWGIAPCGRNDVPNIYTHVKNYIENIKKVTGS